VCQSLVTVCVELRERECVCVCVCVCLGGLEIDVWPLFRLGVGPSGWYFYWHRVSVK